VVCLRTATIRRQTIRSSLPSFRARQDRDIRRFCDYVGACAPPSIAPTCPSMRRIARKTFGPSHTSNTMKTTMITRITTGWKAARELRAYRDYVFANAQEDI